jgi:hypothetical protein
MHLVRFKQPLAWGKLDLPLLGITQDWYQKPVDPPVAYSLAADPERLWFVAARNQPATIHPQARPGQFQAELWKYDVAELFLLHPESGRYMELNLAPNGAWWSVELTAPRERAHPHDEPWPQVETYAELSPDGSWVAAITLPLKMLERRLGFGPTTKANVAFIINSPNQQFLTAAPLGEGEPDFHRPALFPALQIHDGGLPESKSHS